MALAAAWLTSAAGVDQPAPISNIPARSRSAIQADAVSFDVRAQAERLRRRLATAPAPQPTRNPFTFAEDQPIARPVETRSQRTQPAYAEEDPEPALTLIGIAEDGSGKALVRTAIISDADEQLYLVRVGQPVAAGYVVTRISPDAVELKHAASGEMRRLGLK